MPDDIARVRRGLLLTAAHAQYPHPLTELALELQTRAFYAGQPRELVRDLAYLVDSGYLTRGTEKVAAREFSIYRITPEGIDIVDGSTSDPGIEIGG